MAASIPRIEFPEIFLGFVSPIGADLSAVVAAFRRNFERQQYRVVEVKVTDVFSLLTPYILPNVQLVRAPLQERYRSHIAYGNQLRTEMEDDAILALLTVHRIVHKRLKPPIAKEEDRFSRTVFFLHQFKREEEIELLRAIYGQLFFQVSVYSRRGSRVDHLSRLFAKSRYSANAQQYRAEAEEIIQQDENERDEVHGQRVGRIFHDADFIVSLDTEHNSIDQQVERFCELIFSSNKISPTKIEYGMFAAKAAALKTLDLARQVGAAVFTEDAEILALGSNEVPRGNGGVYWPDDERDDRDYVRGYDSNDRRKREILAELVEAVAPDRNIDDLLNDKRIRDSQFMDALEYGRIVHAEMAAISDAARLGRSLRDSTLYCTTFPCHMCAKHIVAAGIARVVFLEPYPKSLAADLHSDSLQIEGSDRGNYQAYPSVQFEHFYGVTPRRYRELFERGRRKNQDGAFVPYQGGTARPLIDIKAPFYTQLEELVLKRTASSLATVISDEE